LGAFDLKNYLERKNAMTTYLTTTQAAALMGLDPRSVRDLCKQGLLPGAVQAGGEKAWKIPLKAVTDWIERNSSSSAGQGASTSISGDHITVGESRDSIQAIGRKAQVNVTQVVQNPDLARAFERIQEAIAARPDDPDLDKQELSTTVVKIEEELGKGEEANPSKIQRWLKFLAMMAPDILEVVLAALTGPIPGITAAVRVIAEKVKSESAPGEA
jgi:hypothetical protein